MRTTSYFLVAAAALALPGLAAAQSSDSSPLRLADALAEADRRAFANRQASANAANSRAQAALPLKGVLPSARVEGGFVRTTDPIGAFGTTLGGVGDLDADGYDDWAVSSNASNGTSRVGATYLYYGLGE